VVSNHGGRQLDGAPSSIAVLPEIAEAVGSQIEILFDGGIRSGPGRDARGRARRPILHDRPRLHPRPRAFGGPGVAKAIDLIRQRAQHHHGPVRRQLDRRNRRSRDCGLRGPSSRSIVVAASSLPFSLVEKVSSRSEDG